ncbi:MAG TPA: pitrilysin family protein [Bryobacteraceae bacterium]|nr:pitrilysin family protein [Bryobacteraceae bacterium]
MRGLHFPILLAAGALWLPAQSLADFEKRVTEFSLPNGLHFVVVERHEAPVVSFETLVNVGSAEDASGQTGLAHLFEHLAFKGTETIGTRDWPSEKRALEAVEEAADKLAAERNKGPLADAGKLAGLDAEWKVAIDRAQTFVIPNQYAQIFQQNGGVDLLANAGYDSTEFRYSLPSNRLELWFLMESQRLLHPVMREFYRERDVVAEEDRVNVEQSPQGRMVRNLLATAFQAQPYRNPELGWPGDVASLRASQAQAFFDKYYVPGNMTMTLVGDVNPAEAKRLAERYFGPLPARPLPPVPHATDPPQNGPRTVEIYANTQPFLMAAYKRPDMYDKDDPVFDVIRLILSNGRTGMLTTQLVDEKRVATVAQLVTPFPRGRYPNLAVFFVVPAIGHTVAEAERALDDLLSSLQTKRIETEPLLRARTQARAAVIRDMATNAGLASSLALYQAGYGDWRKLFTSVDDLNKVTAEDIQRVARQYFVINGRTLAVSGPQPVALGDNR